MLVLAMEFSRGGARGGGRSDPGTTAPTRPRARCSRGGRAPTARHAHAQAASSRGQAREVLPQNGTEDHRAFVTADSQEDPAPRGRAAKGTCDCERAASKAKASDQLGVSLSE
jgi:hypothetical protein